MSSPPPAPSQPSKQNSPLAINLDPVELIFSTPPTSPHPFLDSLEDLPPRTTNPPPPQPSFKTIERLANQPPPLPAMEPPLQPLPPQLPPLPPQLPPLGPNNPFLLLTHEIFCDHYQRTQVIVNDLREEMRFILNHILERLDVLSKQGEACAKLANIFFCSITSLWMSHSLKEDASVKGEHCILLLSGSTNPVFSFVPLKGVSDVARLLHRLKEIATPNAIFMANLSPVGSINGDTVEPRYDSDILSEVPHYDTYHESNMLNSNVQEMRYIENIVFNNESYDKLTSNNNVISYADYMVTIGNDADNYVPPPVQNNDMIF
ncbi:hypothetical protein Tco_0945260 [Tanacetum coccineum]